MEQNCGSTLIPNTPHLSLNLPSFLINSFFRSMRPDSGIDLDPEIGERVCRICQLSLVDDEVIQLGCCCKHDLAAAHKHCAHTWFKIRGNLTCEICNSVVSNLVGSNEVPMMDVNQPEEEGAGDVVVVLEISSSTRGGGRGRVGGGCINSHRLLNLILACLVFAFVISWLFHFNIPS